MLSRQPDPPSRLHRLRGDPPVPIRPDQPDGGQTGRGYAPPGRRRPSHLRHQDRAASPGPAGPGPRRRDRPVNRLLTQLLRDRHDDLFSLYAVGIDSAAALLVAAGDNPDRLRSEPSWARPCGVAHFEASSGKVVRYSLLPRRRPPSQRRAMEHRDYPHELRCPHPPLRGASKQRTSVQKESSACSSDTSPARSITISNRSQHPSWLAGLTR
jgi:hypothetical protein